MRFIVDEEDVLRLEVGVSDAALVQAAYTVEHLPGEVLDLAEAERAEAVRLDEVEDRSSQQLSHQASVFLEHEPLIQVDALAVGIEPESAARRAKARARARAWTDQGKRQQCKPPSKTSSPIDAYYAPPCFLSMSLIASRTLISTFAASRYLSTARLC